MSEGTVHYEVKDGIASIVFDRPEARNAMTWAMYEGLAQALETIATDEAVRVAVLRGMGHEAFVSGTDIAQFKAFTGAEDGLLYEHRIKVAIDRIERLMKPTIAIIEGWATGGGLIIAAACDFRIAAPNARFGVPVARTLGNCLSIANVARLVGAFGQARVKRILMRAEIVDAEEAAACGFVELAQAGEIEAKLGAMCGRLKEHAPLTMFAAKEALRRIALANLPDDEDLIHTCYDSADFKEGVNAFLAKRKPNWQGR